jgi:hypothetical protein
MKKFAYLMILALASASIVRAQQVSEQQAYETALQFLNAQGGSAMRAPSRDGSPKLSLDYQACTGRKTDLYVYNRDGGGFVIVSADARTVKPVLGYSDSGSIDPDNMPPALQNILAGYQEQIEYARLNIDPHKGALQSASPMGTPVVGPLIKTKWNQDEPYNGLCPMDGKCRTYPGCVACSMAQVMNYWRWPERGYGSHRDAMADSLFVDFSQSVYDWDNMAITYTMDTAQVKIDAVQRIIYDCGISVDMDYSTHGAYPHDIAPSLMYYFNYSQQARIIYRADYETQWDSILAAELDAARPVIYSGYSDDEGHTFICDGYDSENYFHFNLGWGGLDDGYYLTSAIIGEGGKGYNRDQNAIIGIYPDYEDQCRDGMPLCLLDDEGTAVLYDIVGSSEMEELVVPDSTLIDGIMYPIKSIMDGMFAKKISNCKRIITSNCLESIGDGAFYANKNLLSVYISGSVQRIGSATFVYCNNLNSIIVDESSPYFYSPQGSNVIIETATGRLLQACNYSVLPDQGYTIIAEFAFCGFDSIRVLRFPDCVTTVKDGAFYECTNLKEVTFGTGIKTLGEELFYSCYSIEDLYFNCDAAPSITDSSIPAGVTIHVKPSALDSYSTSDWSAYTIVADIDDATSVPAAPAAEQDPIYHDLLGRPVTTPQGMTIRDGAVWYNF